MLIAISGLTTESGWLTILSRKRGSSGAGKDVAANRLVISHHFIPLSFADPLKRILKDVFDFSDDQLWGPSENRNKEDPRYPRSYDGVPLVNQRPDGTVVPVYLTVRKVLQSLGNEWGRDACYTNIWADYAIRVVGKLATGKYSYDQKRGLHEFETSSTNVVITDLRYQNEAEAVRKAGGKLVRVKRKIKEIKVAPTHKSENDLLSLHDDDFDWVLNNNSTIEALEVQVDEMVQKLQSS